MIWTAPADGTAHVAGAIWMVRDIGRSHDWFIRHGAVTLMSGNVISGDPFDRTNPMDSSTGSRGAAVLASIDVAAGNVIELSVVQAAGSPFWDGYGVVLSIDFEADPIPGAVGVGPIALVLLGTLLTTLAARDRGEATWAQ